MENPKPNSRLRGLSEDMRKILRCEAEGAELEAGIGAAAQDRLITPPEARKLIRLNTSEPCLGLDTNPLNRSLIIHG